MKNPKLKITFNPIDLEEGVPGFPLNFDLTEHMAARQAVKEAQKNKIKPADFGLLAAVIMQLSRETKLDKAFHIYTAVCQLWAKNYRPPTYREIMGIAKISTTSIVGYHLRLLRDLGYLHLANGNKDPVPQFIIEKLDRLTVPRMLPPYLDPEVSRKSGPKENKTAEIYQAVGRLYLRLYRPPTVREIQAEIGGNSTSAIHYTLKRLAGKDLFLLSGNLNRPIPHFVCYYFSIFTLSAPFPLRKVTKRAE